jgi:hypothetical protein
MDRTIVYPGAIPLDTDLLTIQRNAMVSLGALATMTLGTGTIVDGLACMPTAPASLVVQVGGGSITQLSTVDQNAFGSLPADLSPLVKIGVSLQTQSFTLTTPTTSGQSVNYLIQATLQEADVSPVVLPYYNASNPAQPYSGPTNSGVAQNTKRMQAVQLQLKAGAAAPTGAQVTPPVDTGWVGLYVITVNYGQTAIGLSNIIQLQTAPFIPFKLSSLRPGFSTIQAFSISGEFTVPPGVTMCKATVIGGGGGGGWHPTQPSGGGGAGGRAIKIVRGLTPGVIVPVTVGSAGQPPATSGNDGSPGGTSSFGTWVSATGGAGGQGTGNLSGGAGGSGYAGDVNMGGSYGTDGLSVANHGGDGGGPGGARGVTGALPGLSAPSAGGGGGGGGAGSGAGYPGGAGGGGFVVVEY